MGFDLSRIAELLNLKPRFWFGILLSTSALLFLPSKALDRLGLKDFRDTQKTWIGLVFLGSNVFLGSYAAGEIWSIGQKKYLDQRQIKLQHNQMFDLSPPEKMVLREYTENQETTRYFQISDGIVNGLVAKGILYCSSNVGVHYMSFSFNLQPWAWKYLDEHPEVLEDRLAISQDNNSRQQTSEKV